MTRCSMAISLTCPSCERALKVKDELAGRKIKCPACGSVIAVVAKESNSEARITAKKPQPVRASREEDEPEEQERPKKQQELSSYYENNGQINEYLKNKWVTFIWGVRRQALDELGSSNTVLAYETDPDARGIRMVLFGDGSVDGLNEDAFQKAPKAKG